MEGLCKIPEIKTENCKYFPVLDFIQSSISSRSVNRFPTLFLWNRLLSISQNIATTTKTFTQVYANEEQSFKSAPWCFFGVTKKRLMSLLRIVLQYALHQFSSYSWIYCRVFGKLWLGKKKQMLRSYVSDFLQPRITVRSHHNGLSQQKQDDDTRRANHNLRSEIMQSVPGAGKRTEWLHTVIGSIYSKKHFCIGLLQNRCFLRKKCSSFAQVPGDPTVKLLPNKRCYGVQNNQLHVFGDDLFFQSLQPAIFRSYFRFCT